MATMTSLVLLASALLARAEAAGGSPSPSSTGAKPSGSASAASHAKGPTAADLENEKLSYYLGWYWAALLATFMGYQIIVHLVRYIRTIACLNNDTQRYFASPNLAYGRFKKHLLEAPLFRTRHHRELKLSSAINVGTLPSRLQTMFLVSYFAINVLYCTIWIKFDAPEKTMLGEIRNRSGVLAVVNMIPLFVLASRNNPLISWCGISFDTFNLVHRWFGRIVVIESIVHTAAYTINKVHTASWAAMGNSVKGSPFIQSGFIATVGFTFLMFHSPSTIRHAFYETFLHFHIAVAAMTLGMLYIHLKGMTWIYIMYGITAVWATERLTRFVMIIMRNWGNGTSTSIEVEPLPGDCVRIKLRVARPWKFRPGQHAFVSIPSLGLWTNHPFSLAWSDEEEIPDSEKGLPMNRQDILERRHTNMYMIVRRRTGFTDTLFQKANSSPSGTFTAKGYIEGPYGGHSLASYGTVMLWAAGVGISHQVPYVRHLVAGYDNGTVACRRLTLVWIIQSPEHLEWIRPWMTTILSMPRRREVLRIMLFITRPRSTKEVHSPSSSVQMFPGKPNVQALVDQELQEGVGAGVVTVCGTGGLADDVRKAVRARQSTRNVDFKEEAFSW